MIQLHPEAQRELHAALDYYEAISGELADAFETAIRGGRDAIAASPRAWGLASGRRAKGLGVRRFVLKEFPYVLPYVVLEDLILVLAVAHTSRRPGFWIARVPAP